MFRCERFEFQTIGLADYGRSCRSVHTIRQQAGLRGFRRAPRGLARIRRLATPAIWSAGPTVAMIRRWLFMWRRCIGTATFTATIARHSRSIGRSGSNAQHIQPRDRRNATAASKAKVPARGPPQATNRFSISRRYNMRGFKCRVGAAVAPSTDFVSAARTASMYFAESACRLAAASTHEVADIFRIPLRPVRWQLSQSAFIRACIVRK